MGRTQSAAVANPARLYIGGAWVEPSSSSKISVVTPSTEEVYEQFAEAQESDVNRAVDAARAAFDRGPWPSMPVSKRAEFVRRLGDGVARRTKDLAFSWTSEVGMARSLTDVVVPNIGAIYHSYADLEKTFPFEEERVPQAGGNFGLLVREPAGVVAAIVPWNGPLFLTTHKIAPALLAGCTVVLKASPEAPSTPYIIAEIAEEIGLPAGVLNVLVADRAVSECLVRHPGVDKVSFTGSSAAGKKIASICGERIARFTLELGGKSAAIILDDYDLGKAADMLSLTARMMTGQACSALTRVIVTRDRHDELVDGLANSYAAIKVGDPFDAATEMGPLAMARQRDRVENYIAVGKAEGARLAFGGGRPANLNRGYFVEPTVFSNVDRSMRIAREEIFGPVISVIPADSEAQALELANDSEFGLNASVFTDDVERAYEVARKLRTGTVGHNDFINDFSIAFGGFKQSGIGREGGAEGLHAYTEAKTIVLDSRPKIFRR